MNFRTNFDKAALIGNMIIEIRFEDKKVLFKPPTLADYLYDLDFLDFITLIQSTPEDYNKSLESPQFIVETIYETLSAILKLGYKQEIIIKYFTKYFINADFKGNLIYFDDVVLTSEEYDVLLNFFLISCGEKEYVDTKAAQEEEKLSDFEKRMKENEEKIKQKKENKTGEKKGKPPTIDQIVVAILYEFPSISLEQIYNMNMFTFYHFWSMVSIVAEERVMSIAAGNGLTDKYTHFTNRGENNEH